MARRRSDRERATSEAAAALPNPDLPARPGAWLPRRLRPTREGWWFLIATLLVGVAAVNAGLNLLFGVFGMMLFLILASGIMSELTLRRLTVSRRLPPVVHAGAPFLTGIAVRNDKPRAPTFSLEVEDLAAERPVERRCYFLKLPAGRQQETSYRHVLPRRGLHRLIGFRLSTRFPFGLIRKSRDVAAPAELLVYPALVPVPMLELTDRLAQHPARHAPRPARGGEFHGLRDFRPGDDPRQIHWRSSARRGRRLVREGEDESGQRVLVVLAIPAVASGLSGESAGAGAPDLERAISLAASVALHLLQRGLSVGLRAPGIDLPPGTGPVTTGALLRALALFDPRRDEPRRDGPPKGMAPAPLPQVCITPGHPEPSVVVVAPPHPGQSAA